MFQNKTVIPELKVNVADLTKRIEKLESEKTTQNAIPTQPIVIVNSQIINGKYNAKTWDDHLTSLNNETKFDVIIFLRNEKLKANSKEDAEAIVQKINTEIEKIPETILEKS